MGFLVTSYDEDIIIWVRMTSEDKLHYDSNLIPKLSSQIFISISTTELYEPLIRQFILIFSFQALFSSCKQITHCLQQINVAHIKYRH